MLSPTQRFLTQLDDRFTTTVSGGGSLLIYYKEDPFGVCQPAERFLLLGLSLPVQLDSDGTISLDDAMRKLRRLRQIEHLGLLPDEHRLDQGLLIVEYVGHDVEPEAAAVAALIVSYLAE